MTRAAPDKAPAVVVCDLLRRSDVAVKVDENGVPHAQCDDCTSYDGKRCKRTGFRPSTICEPAVAEIVAALARYVREEPT